MYDVMAIGNALVDHEYALSDAQLTHIELSKGNMCLADEQQQQQLFAALASAGISPSKQASGGSAANAMYAFASLGGNAFYGCRVGDDDAGRFYLQDLNAAGVTTAKRAIAQTGVTGSCVVAITPDGERTMQSFLGTSSHITLDNIDMSALKDSQWLYLEGYLAMSDTLTDDMTTLRDQANAHNVQVAISFADPAVVKFAKPALLAMLKDGVAAIFCNQEVAMLFTECQAPKQAAKQLLQWTQMVVVTCGADGAIVCQRDQLDPTHVVTPMVEHVLDTNGAGDNYAGTFLYGLMQGWSLTRCAQLASAVASEVIAQFGPRLPAARYAHIRHQLANDSN